MSEATLSHVHQFQAVPRISWWKWAGTLLFVAALFLPGVTLAEDRYWLPLFSKYMALALFALSVDLIWGYTGLLSLGQGVYFGLGAYAAGYSLILQQAAVGEGRPFVAAPDMAMPNFMFFCRLTAVPSWIAPLINIWLALALAVTLPVVLGAIFGMCTFRRRIKGVFFSLVTQAFLLAVFMFVVNQTPYTGGVVGMINLAPLTLFGYSFRDIELYYLITTILALCFLGCAALMRSKFGRILTAIRDNEYRVLALGYSTAMFKTFIFAFAGGLAGLAGALYVSVLGTTGPDILNISFSIEVIVFVAVGGRGTLFGAIIGALLVGFANTYINDEFKDKWPIILGCLFIGVVLFLPDGIVGGVRRAGRTLTRYLPARYAFGIAAPSATTEGSAALQLPSPARVDQPVGGTP